MPKIIKCSKLVGANYHRRYFLPGIKSEFISQKRKADVIVICDDGRFETFTLLLGAISIGWTDLLKSRPELDEVMYISCPGLKIEQFQQIHDCMLKDWKKAESGPNDVISPALFNILHLFARDPLTSTVPQQKDQIEVRTFKRPRECQINSRPIKDDSEDEEEPPPSPITVDLVPDVKIEEKSDDKNEASEGSNKIPRETKQPKEDSEEVKAAKKRITEMLLASKGKRPKEYKCGMCDKKYKTQTSLYDHVATHQAEWKFQCPHCSQKFATQKSLNDHARRHTGGRHKCDHCNKSFHGGSHLQRHMRRAHFEFSDRKTYACQVCLKTFADASGLRKHKPTHSNDRPFKCKICPKTFKTRPVLNAHVKTHNSEKPFCCSHCGARFHAAGTMGVHIKTMHLNIVEERKYLCTECGKKFLRPYNLKVHMRTHTGEQPYKCTQCEKCFTIPQKLRDHMRMHTGEKPFKCKTCGKSFRVATSLTKHFKGNPLCKKNVGPGAYCIPKQSHLPGANTFQAMDAESIEQHPDTERYLALLGGNKLPILREKLVETVKI